MRCFTLSELLGEVGVDFGLLLSLGEFDLGALGSLGDIESGFFFGGELGVLLSAKGSGIVRLVPLNDTSQARDKTFTIHIPPAERLGESDFYPKKHRTQCFAFFNEWHKRLPVGMERNRW